MKFYSQQQIILAFYFWFTLSIVKMLANLRQNCCLFLSSLMTPAFGLAVCIYLIGITVLEWTVLQILTETGWNCLRPSYDISKHDTQISSPHPLKKDKQKQGTILKWFRSTLLSSDLRSVNCLRNIRLHISLLMSTLTRRALSRSQSYETNQVLKTKMVLNSLTGELLQLKWQY